MRCERQPGAERDGQDGHLGHGRVVELLLLPIVNIAFLLIPVLLVVIEVTSLAAMQASMPDLSVDMATLDTPCAGRTPAQLRSSQAPEPPPPAPGLEREPSALTPPPASPSPFFDRPDQIVGYGP